MPADFAPHLHYTESGISDFRFWCQKTLPLVYDDSLSYYELLSKLTDFMVSAVEDMHELDSAYTELQEYVNHYFDTADFAAEIDAKLDEMAVDGRLTKIVTPVVSQMVNNWLDANAEDYTEEYLSGLDYNTMVAREINKMGADGRMSNIVGPIASDVTSAWLTAHITQPTSPVVDTSLSVKGAAADAWVTGLAKKNLTAYNSCNLLSMFGEWSDEVIHNGVRFTPVNANWWTPYYRVNGTTPTDSRAFCNIMNISSWPIGCNVRPGDKLYATVTATTDHLRMAVFFYIDNVLDSNTRVTVTTGTTTFVVPANATGILARVEVQENTAVVDATIACILLDSLSNKNITALVEKSFNGKITDLASEGYPWNPVTLSDITKPGFYVIPDTSNVVDGFRTVPTDVVYGRVLIVERCHPTISTSFLIQRYGSLYSNKIYTSTKGGVSSPWTSFALSGGGGTTEINNNYYSNTYNVTATPEITYNNNNFLPSTGDTTDRTADIAALIASTGYCKLGPGDFYTTGITLPNGSTLEGCGASTRIILDQNIEDGAAVYLRTRACVRNMSILSTSDDSFTPNGSIGTRHGILFEYPGEGSQWRSMIDGVTICGFSGGGITLRNAGINPGNSVLVCNAHIYHCNVGIYIPEKSEYHSFTNVNCNYNYYGAIVNTGNNQFNTCHFSRNTVALQMDGSNYANNGHGSFIGCTFNHSGGNPGTAIVLNSVTNGEAFVGCNLHYGYLVITGCNLINWSNCEFGNQTRINISASVACNFNNCMILFPDAITTNISSSSTTKFNQCYTNTGGVFDPMAHPM